MLSCTAQESTGLCAPAPVPARMFMSISTGYHAIAIMPAAGDDESSWTKLGGAVGTGGGTKWQKVRPSPDAASAHV